MMTVPQAKTVLDLRLMHDRMHVRQVYDMCCRML